MSEDYEIIYKDGKPALQISMCGLTYECDQASWIIQEQYGRIVTVHRGLELPVSNLHPVSRFYFEEKHASSSLYKYGSLNLRFDIHGNTEQIRFLVI